MALDDATLTALRTALHGSPDNTQLFQVVAGALIERGSFSDLMDLVRRHSDALTRDSACLLELAQKLIAAGRHTEVLELPLDGSPAALMLRARSYHALDQNDAGLEAYRAAVEESPALEDTELEALLLSRTSSTPISHARGDRSLKVVQLDRSRRPERHDDEGVAPVSSEQLGSISFGDIGGLDEVKETIRRKIILPFQKPSLFERFKKRSGGGVLLYGPPGCGKTLIARAIAGECKARFYPVMPSDILDPYYGESERRLAALFEKARSSVPAVLFFDELEALGGKRSNATNTMAANLVSQFLNEMDGVNARNDGVLILGATNLPWSVDMAFRRPGRFDRVLFVPPPDQDARRAILELKLDGRPTDGKLDTAYLAKHTSGYTGADLENLIETAADEAIADSISAGHDVPISDRHLKEALRVVKSTTMEWLTTARNYARYANESGHYDDVLEFLKKHGK